jgi:hypothetical protein
LRKTNRSNNWSEEEFEDNKWVIKIRKSNPGAADSVKEWINKCIEVCH